jgi:hypothetical protein
MDHTIPMNSYPLQVMLLFRVSDYLVISLFEANY